MSGLYDILANCNPPWGRIDGAVYEHLHGRPTEEDRKIVRENWQYILKGEWPDETWQQVFEEMREYDRMMAAKYPGWRVEGGDGIGHPVDKAD